MKDSSVSGSDIEQKKFSFDMRPAEHGAEVVTDEAPEIEQTSSVDGPVKANPVSSDMADEVAVAETRGCLPGGVLAAERKRRGFTVIEIANQLFLTERQISALEADDYDHFPAPIFVTGYIRNYARLLDLPPDPLVELFNAQSRQSAPMLDRVSRTTGSVPDGNVKSFDPRIVVGVVATLILIVLLWLGMSSNENEVAVVENVSMSADSSMAPMLSASDVISDEVPVTVTVAPVERAVMAPVPDKPAKPVDVVKVVPPVVANEEIVVTEPTVEFIADRAAAESFPDSMELTFTAESWVEITDASGRRVMFDLGKPGQTRALSGTAPFKVLFGYSSAVMMTYNGEPFDQSAFARGKVAKFTLGTSAE